MACPPALFAELTAKTPELFTQLGLSVLLGLLVGLQREHAAPGQPGMRTFTLITVLGTLCAILAKVFGGWIVVAGLLSLAVVMGYADFLRIRQKDPDPGTTTDVAVLVMYGVGALLTVAPMAVAIAIGGGVAVLLQFKLELHRIAQRLGDEDLRAIMQFVLITCIILPVLPNETYGPLNVLNPFITWLLVVFIVGMSLGGYIIYKFFGRDAGILLGGVLGGIISSTATTVSYSRQARDDRSRVRTVAVVIMIASTVAYMRVLASVAVVSREFFLRTLGPVSAMLLLTLVPSLILWFRVRREPATMAVQENPTQLKSAITFALMYSVVLLALAAAREYLNGQGMIVVAGLSGLTDMDAITLSTARMSLEDPDVAATGWRLIVAAAVANLVAKAVLAGVIGGRRMLGEIAVLFAIPFVGGIAMLVFWR
jgi:uncharacterized membrane protein (DUF4010 family)